MLCTPPNDPCQPDLCHSCHMKFDITLRCSQINFLAKGGNRIPPHIDWRDVRKQPCVPAGQSTARFPRPPADRAAAADFHRVAESPHPSGAGQGCAWPAADTATPRSWSNVPPRTTVGRAKSTRRGVWLLPSTGGRKPRERPRPGGRSGIETASHLLRCATTSSIQEGDGRYITPLASVI